MSTAFLSATPAGDALDLRVSVEVAWGADLVDIDGSGWTWDDITEYVLMSEGAGAVAATGGADTVGSAIFITLGRPDFSTETQTANMVCELDNRDGRFSEDGMSPYWPNVRRGTPVRVRVSPDGGSTWYLRFQGAADGFTPQWDPETGRWATVTLSASGPLRRLNQGTLPAKSVYASEIPRRINLGYPGLIAYWPCEGGDGFRPNPPAYPEGGHPALILDDAYTPKAANVPSTEAFPMSGPLQSHMKMFAGYVSAGGEPIPPHTATGTYQVRFMFATPKALPVWATKNNDDTYSEHEGEHWQPLFHLRTTNSTVPAWSLQFNDLGWFRVVGLDDSDNIIRTDDPPYEWGDMNGTPFYCSVTFVNSGSSLNVTLRTVDATGNASQGTFSFSNSNLGTCDGLDMVGPDCSGRYAGEGTGTENTLVAHVSLHNSGSAQINNSNVVNLFLGLPGETTHERLVRLCDRHRIYVDLIDSSVGVNSSITDRMGPQYYDTLANLLRECERTGQGVLYDGLGPGLTYITKQKRWENANGPAALVLDAAQGHLVEPFAPVDDDALTFNHCDVTLRNGASVTYIKADGQLGADAIGDYATAITVNPYTDTEMIRYAEWMVGAGMQEGYRYPSVSFALEAHPELIEDWLQVTPQSRIDVENITAIRRQHSPEAIKLMVEGWQEEISAYTWRVSVNASPAKPWNVIRAAASTGSTGDGICHLDTVSSQLASNAAAGATTITVRTNSGPRWVTPGDSGAGGADNFPFDISVGGCKVTVTNISGTSTSGQTFTLAAPGLPRAMTGSATPGQGTPVKVWDPPVLGF